MASLNKTHDHVHVDCIVVLQARYLLLWDALFLQHNFWGSRASNSRAYLKTRTQYHLFFYFSNGIPHQYFPIHNVQSYSNIFLLFVFKETTFFTERIDVPVSCSRHISTFFDSLHWRTHLYIFQRMNALQLFLTLLSVLMSFHYSCAFRFAVESNTVHRPVRQLNCDNWYTGKFQPLAEGESCVDDFDLASSPRCIATKYASLKQNVRVEVNAARAAVWLSKLVEKEVSSLPRVRSGNQKGFQVIGKSSVQYQLDNHPCNRPTVRDILRVKLRAAKERLSKKPLSCVRHGRGKPRMPRQANIRVKVGTSWVKSVRTAVKKIANVVPGWSKIFVHSPRRVKVRKTSTGIIAVVSFPFKKSYLKKFPKYCY